MTLEYQNVFLVEVFFAGLCGENAYVKGLRQRRFGLAALTVRASANEGTYDRDLFPHWSAISGNCNAR